MTRPLRLAYPGALYNVTTRQTIYTDDPDRYTFFLEARIRVDYISGRAKDNGQPTLILEGRDGCGAGHPVAIPRLGRL